MSNEDLVKLVQQGIDKPLHMELLYVQNKGLINKIVRRYQYAFQSDYNSTPIIEKDELMHEAYFGLVKAVEGYNPCQGVLFTTYATYWIGQAIKRFLDNCGRVVRVSVHTQEKIHKYNQVTSYYLQHFNREPAICEYVSCLGISEKSIEKLQRYIFQDKLQSLDEVLLETDGDDTITIADTLATGTKQEYDIVEKVAREQLQVELWKLISLIMKDDQKVQIIRLRYVDSLTLKEIGERFKINTAIVEQSLIESLRLLKRNTKVRRLAVEFDIWDVDKSFRVDLIKRQCDNGRYDLLNKKELKYAQRMGWMNN